MRTPSAPGVPSPLMSPSTRRVRCDRGMEATNRSSSGSSSTVPPRGVVRLAVTGARLDATTGKALVRDAEETLAAGATGLVIDLGSVGCMDSVGVAALAAIKRRAPAHARVVLAAMTPYVLTVARVTHLARLFDVYATVEAALEALRG